MDECPSLKIFYELYLFTIALFSLCRISLDEVRLCTIRSSSLSCLSVYKWQKKPWFEGNSAAGASPAAAAAELRGARSAWYLLTHCPSSPTPYGDMRQLFHKSHNPADHLRAVNLCKETMILSDESLARLGFWFSVLPLWFILRRRVKKWGAVTDLTELYHSSADVWHLFYFLYF